MTGVETGSYCTVVRIHKKLPCKCPVRKILEFTCDMNVGFPVSRQFCICTNSVVMIPSLSSIEKALLTRTMELITACYILPELL